MAKGELYTPLSQTDHESPPYINDNEDSKNGSTCGIRLSICFYIVTALFIFSNLIWSGIFLSSNGFSSAHSLDLENDQSKNEAHPNYAIAPNIPTQYKPFLWNTMYNSEDPTVQDEVWDSIIWTHGLIAVDREWAKSQNWPETMARPNNDSQAVYLLEAYHQVHCLRVMRQVVKGKFPTPLSESQAHHLDHCFDYLLHVRPCTRLYFLTVHVSKLIFN